MSLIRQRVKLAAEEQRRRQSHMDEMSRLSSLLRAASDGRTSPVDLMIRTMEFLACYSPAEQKLIRKGMVFDLDVRTAELQIALESAKDDPRIIKSLELKAALEERELEVKASGAKEAKIQGQEKAIKKKKKKAKKKKAAPAGAGAEATVDPLSILLSGLKERFKKIQKELDELKGQYDILQKTRASSSGAGAGAPPREDLVLESLPKRISEVESQILHCTVAKGPLLKDDLDSIDRNLEIIERDIRSQCDEITQQMTVQRPALRSAATSSPSSAGEEKKESKIEPIHNEKNIYYPLTVYTVPSAEDPKKIKTQVTFFRFNREEVSRAIQERTPDPITADKMVGLVETALQGGGINLPGSKKSGVCGVATGELDKFPGGLKVRIHRDQQLPATRRKATDQEKGFLGEEASVISPKGASAQLHRR